ncbi:maltodextrin phosphorylase [Anaerobranca californiensis DSM 14826]|jgi:starch phosphorylase|uniref:Alpha-1,4 glucan phosphorylase n=1 Tax=Anaerobranca californiensis DSM 14826 TaxID=1120989 RepID=A0A1M6RP04_9FIRM|nr:glycogen/starch/alpha-glucan phosphorylase [Anaerobranca californiensis]SHK34047.1 maltodextrin phosphorylase [Anaerobranca californiensis DSM 14826]
MKNKEVLLERMERYALTTFGKRVDDLNNNEKYVVLAKALMEEIVPQWLKSQEKFAGKKQAYYLSAEFLMGRALTNNLINMQRKKEVEELLAELGVDYNQIEDAEEDAALGNGGLGRLAACFLDSAATLDYPLHGYGIRYQYGIFKQKFIDGFQVEEGDNWLEYGEPWSIRKGLESVIVSFADGDVKAVPYDTPVIGYGQKTINTLRLWQAEAVKEFDFQAFNEQEYDLAVKAKNDAENISKVLYPNDSTDEGKLLRLKQQYFFVSASLQDLVRKHKAKYNTLENFHKLHAIQLNDTHPAVAIPEMMRILTKVEGLEWSKAWEIVVNTFAYTNHTLLAEALEQWSIKLYKKLLPEIYTIIEKIDGQLKKELLAKGVEAKELDKYAIIHNGNIKMAWLSIYGTKSTNGVAQLHTNLLINQELNHWYKIYPERFNNKTNGITQRRWLLQSNPELSNFITELLGSDAWITNLTELKKLEKFADDQSVLQRFMEIKKMKKEQLAAYIKRVEGIDIDTNSIFDIQIKRLHEYKRQLLKAFYILDLYYRLKENPDLDIIPRTFIFGAKAAPGYFRAKGIIKFINEIAKLVNNDKEISGKIKVVFVQNYRVSYAEKLFPAADVSEQISTAGKEASGTGNMKFMLNGAPTIGTYDGANVEIVEEAGEENNFIFGLRVEDIAALKDYNPKEEYKKIKGLQRVVDSLVDGTFDDGKTGMFKELHDALLIGASWHKPDHYYVIKDFESYREAQQRVNDAYKDRLGWARKCWINLANSGKFSSDRTIDQYAKEIWEIEKA